MIVITQHGNTSFQYETAIIEQNGRIISTYMNGRPHIIAEFTSPDECEYIFQRMILAYTEGKKIFNIGIEEDRLRLAGKKDE